MPSQTLHHRQKEEGHPVSQHAMDHCANMHNAGSLVTRRALLGFVALLAAPGLPQRSCAAPAGADDLQELADIESEAMEFYAERDFKRAAKVLNGLIARQPDNPRWYEMRAQVLVDGKAFPEALRDFDDAISRTADEETLARARLHAGRALAHEGNGSWGEALADYDVALATAASAGKKPDPYVLNSRGNAHASLGHWPEARNDYLASAAGFQAAKGFRGQRGSTTQRLDGAVFAASNAAVMLVQLGQEEAAVAEMQRVARRAPGSADMRAALAAMYWSQGLQQDAEAQWEYACNRITVGCDKYTDLDWLARIRRWPPRMVERMRNFLAVNASGVAPATARPAFSDV